MWGVILSVTWACGPPIGMKNLFHCHPSTSVILSEVAAATESKDPYAAHSLSTGTFFDGAARPQRISGPLPLRVGRARSRRTPIAARNHSVAAGRSHKFEMAGGHRGPSTPRLLASFVVPSKIIYHGGHGVFGFYQVFSVISVPPW